MYAEKNRRASIEEAEQNLPLIEEELTSSSGFLGLKSKSDGRGRSSFLKRNWMTILLIAYSLATTGLLVRMAALFHQRHLPAPYSPVASPILGHELQDAWREDDSVYAQAPSAERDAAWEDLMLPIYMNVTKDEVLKSNNDPKKTVQMIDGGYISSLGIYHEIHCLRRMYWGIFDDVYFPNRTKEERDIEKDHALHCVETLRRSLMCQPNTALYVFQYKKGFPELTGHSQRQCVKWAPFHAWMLDRSTRSVLSPKLVAEKDMGVSP